eukprot:scaffold84642_cov63-Phaeocystis_antarctica.AAC.2
MVANDPGLPGGGVRRSKGGFLESVLAPELEHGYMYCSTRPLILFPPVHVLTVHLPNYFLSSPTRGGPSSALVDLHDGCTLSARAGAGSAAAAPDGRPAVAAAAPTGVPAARRHRARLR